MSHAHKQVTPKDCLHPERCRRFYIFFIMCLYRFVCKIYEMQHGMASHISALSASLNITHNAEASVDPSTVDWSSILTEGKQGEVFEVKLHKNWAKNQWQLVFWCNGFWFKSPSDITDCLQLSATSAKKQRWNLRPPKWRLSTTWHRYSTHINYEQNRDKLQTWGKPTLTGNKHPQTYCQEAKAIYAVLFMFAHFNKSLHILPFFCSEI